MPLLWPTYNADVAKLVGAGHGVVVEHGGAGQPARTGVISEDDELVLLVPVADEVEALLHVAHHDAVTHRVDVGDEVRNVLRTSEKYFLNVWRKKMSNRNTT